MRSPAPVTDLTGLSVLTEAAALAESMLLDLMRDRAAALGHSTPADFSTDPNLLEE